MSNRIDAFGHIVTDERNSLAVAGGEGLLKQYTVELDKSTGETHPVEGDPISIPELVASYEEQCGMEWARRMLRSGQLTPEMLADDGRHGGDYSGSTELNVAYRDAKAAKAKGDQVAASLGVEGYMDAEDITALVNQRVQEILDAQKAAASSEGESK